MSIYKGLDYSTKEINGNFKIKVFGFDENGKKLNIAVGVSGLIRLIGIDLTNKIVNRAFNSNDDKCVCKLRRGINITFYSH